MNLQFPSPVVPPASAHLWIRTTVCISIESREYVMQVAARYMLVQHRDVVHELFHHGHINEREFEGLVGQNNMARVRLDYHPHIDNIPDRCVELPPGTSLMLPIDASAVWFVCTG